MVISLVLAGAGVPAASADPAVLVGFFRVETRLAVQHAVEGALRRLDQPECQRVFADFSLAVPAVKDVAAVRYIDDPEAAQCARPGTLAFTAPGGRVVHLCGKRFTDRFFVDRMRAEIVVIHELLHVRGLGENPPTSAAISAQVAVRCAP